MQTTSITSVLPLLQKTNDAASRVSLLSNEQKQAILKRLADVLIGNKSQIMQENEKDLVKMSDDNPKKDRLLLTEERIENLAKSLHDVAALPDPTHQVLLERKLENGLELQKVAAPLGVVGVIYEARPNVTIDVVALCLRAGNAVVLRGGSDAEHTNIYLVQLIHEVLAAFEVNTDSVLLLPVDRIFVKEMLEAERYIDIIIPRGSQSLIDFVRKNAKVPTIETGAGVCHTFITQSANLEKAKNIVVNAKVSRPSVCNSLDTILVEEKIAAAFLPTILAGMKEYEVEIFADETAHNIIGKENYPYLQKATEEDFGREFLSYKCSIKIVQDLDEALAHIRKYSSRHSEAIVTEDNEVAERFLKEVDAAAVYANASTRFTDGGVFGLGAEIGISTQKLHARGPFALEKLVTEKWIVRGNGQVR